MVLSTGFAFAQEQSHDDTPIGEAVGTDTEPGDENRIYEFVELDPSFTFEGQNLSAWLNVKVAGIRSVEPTLPAEKVYCKSGDRKRWSCRFP